MSEAELLEALLARPRSERANMALRLLESLDGPADEMTQEEWDSAALEEYRSRRAAHLSGEVRMIPADEALASARARFARGS